MKQYGRQQMKMVFFLLMFLGLSLANGLVAQTIEDGFKSYQAANMARTVGEDDSSVKKTLEDTYQIFKGLASEKNSQALAMYYLLAIKLEKNFSQQELLDKYVKNEHPDYPTVASLQLYGDDNAVLLSALKKLADQNREKATNLMNDAKTNETQERFEDALDNVLAAERLWKMDGINDLKTKYERLKKKKAQEDLIARIRKLGNQGQFQEAITTIDGAVEQLEPSQMASLKGEIKDSWSKKLLNEAKIEFQNKNYISAISKCDEAYRLNATNEALKLKQKSEKKKNHVRTARISLFGDFGTTGAIGLKPQNYSWSGNSAYGIDIRDHGSLNTELITENEDDAKLTFGYSGGLIYMFSSSLGISASVSPFTKQLYNILSDYSFTVSWDNNVISDPKRFTDPGSISILPVSFNLMVVLKISTSLSMNLYAGPTLYLTNIDLRTHIGYSGFFFANDELYIDWFPFEYRIQKKESVFGGNCGAELEFKTSAISGMYIGIQYFFSQKKGYEWNLISQRYDSELNGLYTNNPYGLSPRPSYKSNINLSTYKFNLGIKLYL